MVRLSWRVRRVGGVRLSWRVRRVRMVRLSWRVRRVGGVRLSWRVRRVRMVRLSWRVRRIRMVRLSWRVRRVRTGRRVGAARRIRPHGARPDVVAENALRAGACPRRPRPALRAGPRPVAPRTGRRPRRRREHKAVHRDDYGEREAKHVRKVGIVGIDCVVDLYDVQERGDERCRADGRAGDRRVAHLCPVDGHVLAVGLAVEPLGPPEARVVEAREDKREEHLAGVGGLCGAVFAPVAIAAAEIFVQPAP